MTTSKDGRSISVSFVQAARRDAERKALTRAPSVEQLIERARTERAEFIVAMGRHFAARLRSFFKPGRIKNPNAVVVMETGRHS